MDPLAQLGHPHLPLRGNLTFINIDEGNDIAALAVLDKLITDFNDHQDLPGVVFTVGEQYCYLAFTDKNQPPDEQINRFHKAITIWGKIITQFPNTNAAPQAYYYSAVCYRELGEYEKAIEYFQKAANDWPDYEYAAKALFRIANCYEGLRNKGALPESQVNPQIEQSYKAVVEKYPDSEFAAHTALRLGQINFDRGQWDKAAMYFELFLQKFPQDIGQVVLPLAKAYEQMNEPNLAAELYRTFIETADTNDPHLKSVKRELEKLEAKPLQGTQNR